jgi:asparagine synthase (glutamine-hydrolysing)
MCGIVGFASTQPLLNDARLSAMRDTLRHRGPDDAGTLVWEDGVRPVADAPGRVGLAHRRLSIIDLSDAGHQPMSNEDGSVWLSYNGEFYNFQDYRAELSEQHRFVSNTDSETIIHLYEEHGIRETLERMNGMFAFAVWDAPRQTMILARDRIGQKPLYYTQLSDGSIVFASEIKALLASGKVDTEAIDPVALVQFWTYGYATGEQTIYRDIKQLLPGHYAEWHKGKLSIREYWDAIFGMDEPDQRPLSEQADELEALLSDAIRLRLIADVPAGLFLSGGIDSCLIAALTSKSVGVDLNAFTIGFDDATYDESGAAAAVAAHLGVHNTILPVTEDVQPHVAHIAAHFDEPFGDSSAIPTYFLCKLAREHVTVALTGDAGDELFGGYNIYDAGLGRWGTASERRRFRRPASVAQRGRDVALRMLGTDTWLTELEMLADPRTLQAILADAVWESAHAKGAYASREQWYGRTEGADALSRMQYMNMKTYLPDDVLVKVDRMSMASSLECRSPLLDHRVVAFAARLPFASKIDAQGKRKAILRQILSRYVPDTLMDRPKKGFGVPWGEWCKGSLGDTLRDHWQTESNDMHKSAAAQTLFPTGHAGSAAMQWNAFCILQFVKGRASLKGHD